MPKMEKLVSEYPFEKREHFLQWMAQTYHFVRHTPKMLCLSFAHAENPETEKKTMAHLRGEMGHDVLAQRDLKALGVLPGDFPEFPSTKAFWQTQYYWISMRHSTAYLGYALFLECLAAQFGNLIFERVKTSLKLESSFLKVHYEEDQDHTQEGLTVISQLPQEVQAFIAENFTESFYLYRLILKDCAEAAQSTPVKVAGKFDSAA